MNKEKKVLLVSVALIMLVGLLLQAGVLYVSMTSGVFDGDQGPRGLQGPQGLQGLTGAVGPAGQRGKPGSDGDDGSTGAHGPVGPRGPSGEDGVDAPVNRPPVMVLNGLSSMPLRCKTMFSINVSISDPDDMNLSVNFYYSLGDGVWKLCQKCFSSDGFYAVNVTVHGYCDGVSWLVKAWDGSDIAIERYVFVMETV